MTDGDIHNREQINERLKAKIEESELNQSNIQAVQKFVDKLKASGVGKDRIRNYLWSFEYLAKHIDFDLENPDKQDLVQLAGVINGDLRENLSEYSIAELKKTLSKYYGWHLGQREKIDFLSTVVDQSRVQGLKEEEVLRPREVKKITRKAQNPRDQALIMTLWSSGGRIEAVLNTRWEDLELDGINSKLRFTTNKTEPRRIPVAEAAPYLKKYVESIEAESEDFIFTMWEGNQKSKRERGTDQLTYHAAYGAVKRAVERSNVPDQRQTSPHGFRKSRATFLASTGMNAPQLMRFFGWSQMETAKKYIGLAENQLDKAFQQAIGLEDAETESLDMSEEELRPKRCLSCGSVVSPAMKTCYHCGDVINADNLTDAIKPNKEKGVSDMKAEIKSLMEKYGLDFEDVEDEI